MATAELNGQGAATEPEAEKMLREIREMSAAVDSAASDYHHKNESAKAAKKLMEGLQSDLNDFIRASKEEHPLFDGKAVAPPAAAAGPEPWRSESVSALKEHGLAAAIVGKLEVAELTTLGAVQDWIASGKRLTDIDGIGGAKAEAIEEAFVGYWAANPVAEASANAEADAADGGFDDMDIGDYGDDEEAA